MGSSWEISGLEQEINRRDAQIATLTAQLAEARAECERTDAALREVQEWHAAACSDRDLWKDNLLTAEGRLAAVERERDEADRARMEWASAQRETVACLQSTLDALDWYLERAEALASEKAKNPDYAMAILTELSLDGGKHARAALTQDAGDGGGA